MCQAFPRMPASLFTFTASIHYLTCLERHFYTYTIITSTCVVCNVFVYDFQSSLAAQDHFEGESTELQSKIESLESIVRMLELKARNATDHCGFYFQAILLVPAETLCFTLRVLHSFVDSRIDFRRRIYVPKSG